jgi:serine phosphatase RsbU (regulator of sigma subunit)
MKEIRIFSPDGGSRVVPLDHERISLGRSRDAELSFPDDTGLSRHHLTFELLSDGWTIHDEGSRNGTLVNGERIADRTPLQPGDRISAGHLVIVCGNGSSGASANPVVVFDPEGDRDTDSAERTVVTDLDSIRSASASSSSGQALRDISGPAAVHIIAALIRAGNELAGHRPLPELFRFILDLSIETVHASRGVLLTLEEGELVVRAHKGEGFRISTAVRDRVLNSGLSVLVRDTALDDALRGRLSIVEQNIQALMAVPLQTRDQIIGIIYVDAPALVHQFSRDDLNVLTVMANVAAVRIEQARSAEAEQERRLMERELNQAAEIQKQVLPVSPPAIAGLELAGYNTPCHTVGGDYYDFFPLAGGRVALCLGDVSGKGMPASLLMMGLQARVQVLIEEEESPAAMMTRLNRITSANCPPNRFITLFLCVLDGGTGRVRFCNAGHNPPIIARANGTFEDVKGGGPVIGLAPTVEYSEHERHLAEGDSLVIYSDGVSEARNGEGEDFTAGRIAEIALQHRELSAAEIAEQIRKALSSFTDGAAPSDDITLIVARRAPRK